MNSAEPQGCLAALLRLFGIRLGTAAKEQLPYRFRDDFLSPAELAFYRILRSVVNESYTICVKVKQSDILFVPPVRGVIVLSQQA